MKLEDMQESFQSLLMQKPGEDIEKEFEASSLSNEILPRAELPKAWESFNIYRQMYVTRLIDALEADFPCVAEMLGWDLFYDEACIYAEKYPSTSFTLDRFGSKFPEFIRARHEEFLGDMADFEWSVTQLIDIKEAPVLNTQNMSDWSEDDWVSARFIPAESSFIFSSSWNITDLYSAHLEGLEIPKPEKQESHVAVSLVDHLIHRTDLPPHQLKLIKALNEGASLLDGIAIVDDYEWSPEEVQQAFARWVGAKMFSDMLRPN